jgi:hypothetical protein
MLHQSVPRCRVEIDSFESWAPGMQLEFELGVETMTGQTNMTSEQYKQRLQDALEEAYAPLRRGGPGLLKIFSLIVKEIFHPEPPVQRDQPVEPASPKSPAPAP